MPRRRPRYSPTPSSPMRWTIASATSPNRSRASAAIFSNSSHRQRLEGLVRQAVHVRPSSSWPRTMPKNVTAPPSPGRIAASSAARLDAVANDGEHARPSLRRRAAGARFRRRHTARDRVRRACRCTRCASRRGDRRAPGRPRRARPTHRRRALRAQLQLRLARAKDLPQASEGEHAYSHRARPFDGWLPVRTEFARE